MLLTTVDAATLRPATRAVLLKDVGGDGSFTFFTNYGSRKAREIESCPRVALTFLWLKLERQVCVRVRACVLACACARVATRAGCSG